MDEITRRNMLRTAAAAGVTTTVAAPSVASADELEQRAAGSPGSCEWTEEELQDRQRVLNAGFTEDEADAWLLVARAGAKLFSLPELHPSDKPDIVQAIHVLQNKLMLRPAYKKYRDQAPK